MTVTLQKEHLYETAKDHAGFHVAAAAEGVQAPAAAPAAATLDSPANGAANLPTSVTVRWTRSVPGEVYRVQVATDPQMTALVVDARVSNATGYSLYYVAQKNTTYYWRVNVSSRRQTSPWLPVWSFTTTNQSASGGTGPWSEVRTFTVDIFR